MEARKIAVDEIVPASRKLQATDAKSLLKEANTLIAIKGKKVETFDVGQSIAPEAVAAMLGPTGNLRAPTIRVGNTYLVGFSEEVFSEAFR